MLKRIVCIMVAAILIIISTGCIDSSETDDNIYAVAIGIDRGSYNNIVVTVQYPTYKGSG